MPSGKSSILFVFLTTNYLQALYTCTSFYHVRPYLLVRRLLYLLLFVRFIRAPRDEGGVAR
jgi:hypothetical protein